MCCREYLLFDLVFLAVLANVLVLRDHHLDRNLVPILTFPALYFAFTLLPRDRVSRVVDGSLDTPFFVEFGFFGVSIAEVKLILVTTGLFHQLDFIKDRWVFCLLDEGNKFGLVIDILLEPEKNGICLEFFDWVVVVPVIMLLQKTHKLIRVYKRTFCLYESQVDCHLSEICMCFRPVQRQGFHR
jgi:hypothetical protein